MTHLVRTLTGLFAITTLMAAAPPAPAAMTNVTIDGKVFHLPAGFTVECVAGPPLVDRPITADFDELGRLYVSDSSGSSDKVQKQLADRPHRILRLEDTDGDGRFDKSTLFADRMMFPEGTMWLAGSLYVAAPPSIWKLTDTNADGIADARAEWFNGKTLTGCANDLHGPYAGPDGWIYWCKGAFAQQTYDRPGKKPFVTRAAHIFRTRRDGSGLEPVMTGGMDNPVEVVFTPGGERIFTTTFLQQPAAGHRDGLIHAIYGGVYGKVHDVIDDHPRTGPDVMPVLAHLGPAAPCGLVRYEPGTFGDDYNNNLFSTSFNLHKVFRHVLTKDGATFASKDEDFLTCDSLDFHPTHLIEDADGSLIVIDTGGWYKLCCPTSQIGKPDVLGAIYRVKRTGAAPPADPRGLKLDWEKMSPDALAQLFGDPRVAVRKRAIEALGSRGAAAVDAIKSVLEHNPDLARLNAVWAACRIDDPTARAAVRTALTDKDETVRQAGIHAASLSRDRDATDTLITLLSNPSMHNRRAAAEALGRIGDARAVPALLAALAQPNDRVLDHSLTYALMEIADPKATAAGLASDSPAVRRATLVALDQMEGGTVPANFVVAAMSDTDAKLRESAAWIASRHPEWGDALAGAMDARLSTADKLPQTERDDLAHQLAKLSKSPAIQDLLARRMTDHGATQTTIFAAMAETGGRDLPPKWLAALKGALSSKDPDLAGRAAATLRKLALRKEAAADVGPALLAVGARTDVTPAARLEALAALPGGIGAVEPAVFQFLVTQLDDRQGTLAQLSAAEILGRAKLTAQQLASLTPAVARAGPLEMDRLLMAYEKSADDSVGAALVAALGNAKGVTALRPDTLRMRLKHFGPAVQQRGEAICARLDPGAAAQRARLDSLVNSLPAGDVRRGQAVFNNAKVACVSCHAIGYVGGHVGPDLTRVGAVRTRRDLLESILYPSASFVQSFEPVIVETADGDIVSGIARRNDAEEVVLTTGPDKDVHLPRADVKSMRPGAVSVMPAGLEQQLKPDELADLVAFLQACK